MRRKREGTAKPATGPRQPPADRSVTIDGLLLAAVSALLVATPLIPSEATIHEGTAAPLNLLWLLVLFAWAATLILRPTPQIKFGWTGVAAAALIGWHSLSALTAGLQGNGRQALNMFWQFVSYGVAALLLRQLLHSPRQCRALIAVMIALASVEATLGYYEYFVSKPQQQAKFAADPEAAYREVGEVTQTQREQLRWRLESKEPLGTFALTNSLAGLLAPWLIALLGIGVTLVGRRDRWLLLAGVLILAAILVGCLLLTKSRTGILAAAGGVVLLLLFGRTGGWRLNWIVPAAAAAVAVLLALAVVAVGGLDVQVLSQAPTSVLYRLQYWQSTAAMIADHPLLGCGPGQFQSHYTRYKLPEASETIADPHNFLLEIWATAGTPALLALLAMAGALAWQLSRGRGDASSADHPAEPASTRYLIYLGALAGLTFAFPLGLIVGWPQQLVPLTDRLQLPGIWLLGLPTAAACVWLLDEWVVEGQLPTALPVIALIVLLVNLLAAGATSFPGVFTSAWLLMPLALANADAPAWVWHPSRAKTLGILALALLQVVMCARTQFSPVLGSASHIAEATHLLQTGRLAPAEASLLTAARLDPWSPTPWQLLAEMRLHIWIETPSPQNWQRFLAAGQEYSRRDPRHYSQFTAQGNWRLLAWRKSGDPQQLAAAIDAYRQACVWYPGRAFVHAQLAWALHLAGQNDEAAAKADLAERLDALNPHREQKLARQTIYDPQLTSEGIASSDGSSAEQIVHRLRSSSGPENPP